MYRVIKLSGKFYAKRIDSVRADSLDATTFVEEGTPVIFVNELEDLEEIGINPKNVTLA